MYQMVTSKPCKNCSGILSSHEQRWVVGIVSSPEQRWAGLGNEWQARQGCVFLSFLVMWFISHPFPSHQHWQSPDHHPCSLDPSACCQCGLNSTSSADYPSETHTSTPVPLHIWLSAGSFHTLFQLLCPSLWALMTTCSWEFKCVHTNDCSIHRAAAQHTWASGLLPSS